MILSQDMKIENMLAPVAAASDATAVAYLDTIGWDYATIIITHTTDASTSAAWVACALTEGTNSAAATAIVAFAGADATATDKGWAWATGTNAVSTADNTVRFNVDLRKRERYLKVSLTPCQGSKLVGVTGILTRGKQVPGSDAGSVVTDVTG
jgi:hypothetical protein